MSIEILLVTCGRLVYTRRTVESLLSDQQQEFELSIWDNASKDGTREFLDSLRDSRIKQKVFASENVYLTGAANQVFSKSNADLLAIIPDDFILPPDWIRPLASCHADLPNAGLISCWFLGKEFFDETKARHKIQTFGRHRILRHPWTGGGAALFKRKAWDQAGRFEGLSTPSCWIRMARKGYINGFILPPLFVEHMDDPWSPHYSGQPSLLRKMGGRTTTMQSRVFHQAIVQEILQGPWDVKYYIGWRAKLRQYRKRLRRTMRRISKAAEESAA